MSDPVRTQAGRDLFDYLVYKNCFTNNDEIILLSHSHGCNIANYITRLVNPDRPIHMLIHLGCPRRLEDHYQPLHYRYLFFFFSDGDWVAVAGRANDNAAKAPGQALATVVGGMALDFVLSKGIELAVTALIPGAGQILFIAKHVSKASKTVKAIAGLLKGVKAGSAVYNSMQEVRMAVKGSVVATAGLVGTAGAAKAANDILEVGTNEFPVQNGKITVGFRTKVDGANPWHGRNPFDQPGVKDVVPYLQQLIERIHISYPDHYSVSSSFNLNIDRTSLQNPIMLAIRARGNAIRPPIFDYLVTGNTINNTMVTATIPQNARITEAATSNQEANRFQTRYGSNIQQ